ncbi:nicotinate-nucleotide--dimethylbenzimidazole phosphoribosyltransferase [Corynebacterium uterequi]|uniref:Nicotinate-nucleotide-dimethylbenzimidazole phosphoribosyltransferase n=1 Tax=Corynebacterium uterequi TaxID=1072256 RepID=A0A0G3HFH6_9CORY|nr:nicotinate-nucleotide--dimethylbenzimidazole phosphoribosyltransferase [Corynebacterium uterequi]AKK11500.1 nicotinate-nucleotide-dimethylbenzimidazole phosphoribosyltransferase [Corynebacterium uterequi]
MSELTVPSPDQLSADRMTELLASTPRGVGLGRLAGIASSLAAWQHQVPPAPIDRPRVVVFAGDHGIAERGISAYAPQASVEQYEELRTGGGPAQTLARVCAASVRIVDISLDHEAWGDERVSKSCPAIDVSDAMTESEMTRALEIGRRIADQEIDGGADLLLPGHIGVAASTSVAAVVGTLTATEPVAIVGPGSGITDEMWKRKVSVLRDAMFRARAVKGDAREVVRTVGSPEFAALVGFIAQAASRRTPVLLDGAIVSAAAFVADQVCPGVRHWLLASQLSGEPAHLVAVQQLGLTPLLALDLNLGQGAGSVLALSLISAACALAVDEAVVASQARSSDAG